MIEHKFKNNHKNNKETHQPQPNLYYHKIIIKKNET